MEAQAFEYLGKIFTPSQKIKGGFNAISKGIWGNVQSKGAIKLNLYMENEFIWEDFYAIAKKNGCGKIDTFFVDGEERIPCGTWLAFWNKPSEKTVNLLNFWDNIEYAKLENNKAELRLCLVDLFKAKSKELDLSLLKSNFNVCGIEVQVSFCCGKLMINNDFEILNHKVPYQTNLKRLFKVNNNKHRDNEVKRFLEEVTKQYLPQWN